MRKKDIKPPNEFIVKEILEREGLLVLFCVDPFGNEHEVILEDKDGVWDSS